LIDYLILPSAIHAVAHIAGGDSVGGVARAVGNVISRWVREAQPIRGPVFADRYRAEPVLSAEDLRDEIRMLAWRPVSLGLCTTPSHYAQGAMKIALGLATARGFDSRPLLRHFGDTVPEARASLRRWIRRRPSEQEWRAWELTRGLELATGTVGPRFAMARPVQGPAALLIAAGGTYEVDHALRLLALWVSARLHPASPPDLHSASDPRVARGRALVACIALANRVCSAASVARYFGRAKSTLSEQMAACRRRPTDRLIVDTPIPRILEEVAALLAADTPTSNGRRSRSRVRSA